MRLHISISNFSQKQGTNITLSEEISARLNMPRPLNISPNASISSYQNVSSSNHTESGQTDFFPLPLIIILSFVSLLIVVVNGLVIFLILRKQSLRTLTNMFLTSLALSDLLSGLVAIPLLLVCLVKDVINVCVSSAIFIRFTAISSVCHVLLVACDRYIFILHGMQYHSLVTTRRAITAAVIVWFVSFVGSVIQFSWYLYYEVALTEFEEVTKDVNKRYSLACIVLFFSVPLFLMCFIYGRIFLISFKSNQRDRRLGKNLYHPSRSVLYEWRGRSVLLIAMIIFAGCWLPFFFAMLDDYMESSEKSSKPVWVQRLLIFLAFIPPMLNPILCTLAKKDFRRALKQVIFQRKINNASADFRAQHEEVTLTSRAN